MTRIATSFIRIRGRLQHLLPSMISCRAVFLFEVTVAFCCPQSQCSKFLKAVTVGWRARYALQRSDHVNQERYLPIAPGYLQQR